MKLPNLSLYIHIPWCEKKCIYCDFNSYTYEKIPEKRYLKHLLLDLKDNLSFVQNRKIKTIFIGGGTPSILKSSIIDKMLYKIKKMIEISNNAEITIEVNPNDITLDKVYQYKKSGINRISIGIQTFNNKKLKMLGRTHDTKQSKKAIKIIKKMNFKNFNIDIIHSLPNQNIKESIYDVKKLIQLKPPHISWYQLSIEKNTLLFHKENNLLKDEILWKIFNEGHKIIVDNNYKQYEISSYCYKNIYKCKHNLNYWRFGDYIGIGCGSHSKFTNLDGDITRIIKKKRILDYMNNNYIHKSYLVKSKDKIFEYFINKLRLYEHVSKNFFEKFKIKKNKKFFYAIKKAKINGYIIEKKNSWETTKKGKLYLNNLLEFFLP
ncbi:radical SAM family heme chaperone HemW [Buchnera aphidicola (Taiwanaphis decaspermi)]|uniref:radical SAM family heme chaperone HemW n=1 Tax=Buchnera aphidicola TaxID=9 RepID=UPI0031B8A74B